MFNSSFKPKYNNQGGYGLRCPIDSDWSSKEQRVLLIIETIDSEDLSNGRLLSDRSRKVVTNLLNYSIEQVKAEGFKRSKAAFAAVNFNDIKFMDQHRDSWASYRSKFTKRVLSVIQDLEPTHVIVFGDWAAKSLLPSVDHLQMKRGWVFPLKTGSVRCKVVPTLDLLSVYMPGKLDDDDDEEDDNNRDKYAKSNLLFYVHRHVVNGLLGRLRYDLSNVKVKVRYIDTIDKFKALWSRVLKTEVLALDTETKNLTVNLNAINTIQLAIDNSGIGYFIPIDHPDTPFSDEERAYIKRRLRAYIYASPDKVPLKYIITLNGAFDCRILRANLGIPLIRHKIWEITAGEWSLDENLSVLAGKPFGTPHGNLNQIFMTYGNDHYMTSEFGKGDRGNSSLTRLDNPAFLEYGCMDAVSIFAMHEMQKKRAEDLEIDGKNFKPYFVRNVLEQKSNTVHVASHMRQRGVAIDRQYLAVLKSNQSPMLKLIHDLNQDLIEYPAVKKANQILLKEGSGLSTSKGLFNKPMWVFDFGKANHLETLFFNIMKLKPVSFTKTKKPQVNKTFVAAYKNDHPVVEKFGRRVKLKKLWSAYINGWWKKIKNSPDDSIDWRLRADYGFFDVVSGRLNSQKPSLHQTPTRGKEAKYVKRSFKAPPGCIHIKYDYSAHEVRGWSLVSYDEVLAAVFRIGQQLRQKLRRCTSSEEVTEVVAALKKKGDIHISNVKRFFNIWIDKDHPLRYAIKAIVFGSIYGKTAATLAKDIWSNEFTMADDELRALRKEKAQLEKELQ